MLLCNNTGLFQSGDVDDVELQPSRVEEPEDLADCLGTDQLGAGDHSLD